MESNKLITIRPPTATIAGHELVIIPIDSKYKPSDAQIKASLELLQIEYPDCEISSEVYDSVEFVDQGQNFEKVTCNFCSREMSMDFWQEKMSKSYDSTHFDDLNFKTECCGKITNLNKLIYESDCGFASYRLSINNAQYDTAKVLKLKGSLTKCLETEVKVFWKHI